MIPQHKYSLPDIIRFLADKIGCTENEIKENSDLLNDLGCCGDDYDELMDEFGKKFNVQMDSHLWYFHNEDEGSVHSWDSMLFKAPYEMVDHISVTPMILLDSANQGTWTITYPEHHLPKRRYDILTNQILWVLIFVFVLLYECSH